MGEYQKQFLYTAYNKHGELWCSMRNLKKNRTSLIHCKKKQAFWIFREKKQSALVHLQNKNIIGFRRRIKKERERQQSKNSHVNYKFILKRWNEKIQKEMKILLGAFYSCFGIDDRIRVYFMQSSWNNGILRIDL